MVRIFEANSSRYSGVCLLFEWLVVGSPTEVHTLYPKKSLSVFASANFFIYLLENTQIGLCCFHYPKKIPASFIDPKKIPFGQNVRPKKNPSDPFSPPPPPPPSIKVPIK